VVDVAEVRGALQITVVEIGQAGLVAVEAALDRPYEAFAATRRPNSEYTITTTFLPPPL